MEEGSNFRCCETASCRLYCSVSFCERVCSILRCCELLDTVFEVCSKNCAVGQFLFLREKI